MLRSGAPLRQGSPGPKETRVRGGSPRLARRAVLLFAGRGELPERARGTPRATTEDPAEVGRVVEPGP